MFEKVEKNYTKEGTRQAAHVCIFARSNEKLWGKHQIRALVNLHMRFDGRIGFPGGLIDPGENTETGLNREIMEEIGLDLGLIESDWVYAHHSLEKKIVLHFYCKEIGLEDFCDMEKNAMSAKEFGVELLGNIRVPLYTYQNKNKDFCGLPQFLNNNFAGVARNQLLDCLILKEIMTTEEVDKAVEQAKSIKT